MDAGFKYIIENGLCTNISYPYMAMEGECQKDSCESVVKISNYTDEFFKDNSMNFFMKDKEYVIDKSINDDKIVPLEVDWRKKNKVSSVKNQEKCGGCWAFSASEAVEGSWAIKNNVLYNLSQQELLVCS